MQIVNDSTCSWINDLTTRLNIKSFQSNEDCEWLVIGAGYTGLISSKKISSIIPLSKNYY
jgi:hypothetical protein